MTGFNTNPPAQLAASIALPVLGTIVVALRFQLRIVRKTGLGIDDWTCLLALVFTWGCAAIIYWGPLDFPLFGGPAVCLSMLT